MTSGEKLRIAKSWTHTCEYKTDNIGKIYFKIIHGYPSYQWRNTDHYWDLDTAISEAYDMIQQHIFNDINR